MRKMKGSSSYLKRQTIKNLAKASFSLILFCLVLFGLSLRFFQTFQLGFLELAGLVFSLVMLILFYYYLRKYHIYKGGLEGEKKVNKQLNAALSDDYTLINNLYFSDGYGDIDHVIIGPNGVFVLETKNWKGKIICHGDEWHRPGKGNLKTIPSLQVKRNTVRVRRILDSSKNLKPLGIHAEGIVVFTNNHASLNLNNPTVPIVKLSQLSNFITRHAGMNAYSRQQVEMIGKEILKQAS